MTQTPEEKTEELCDNMQTEVKSVISRYGLIVTKSDDLKMEIYINMLCTLCVETMSLIACHLDSDAPNHKSKKIPAVLELIKKDAIERSKWMREKIMRNLP